MCTPRTAAISSAFRPSSVSRIARARSASPRSSHFDRARKAARSAASAVSVDFPGMLGLHSPHPRQTIYSIAHSQAVCLEDADMVAYVASDHIRTYGVAETIPYLRAREREALQNA